MKFFLLLLSVLSFTWLIVTLLRLPTNRVPWCVLAYVLCHLLFSCATWWTWIRVGNGAADDPQYKASYAAWSVVLMVGAVIVSMRYSCEKDPLLGLMLVGSGVVFALSVSWFLGHWALKVFHLAKLTPTIENHLTLAAVLMCCGASTFLSLAVQSDGVEYAVKLSLSMFWLFFAFYLYLYALGALNHHMSWATRNNWIPQVAAIAAFSWLAFTLSSKQHELSRQGLPQVLASEYSVVEPNYD